MAQDPVWKRAVGGVLGIGIGISVVIVLRQRGVSGNDLAQWEEAIVFGAAAAGGVVWLLQRRRRREP